jgi:hypothetical protein
MNYNDSSFQVLGAFGNLSFGKFRRCFHDSELSRWKSCSGKSLDSICGTNEQTYKRTNWQTYQANRASKHPYIKTRKYSLLEMQDAKLPSKIIVSITQFSSNTSYTFEAVHGVSQIHVKYIVTGRVTFSDGRDNEIQSMCPDESLPQPNEWHMLD